MARFGMVIDNRKCVGGMDCVVACKTENDVPDGHCRDWIAKRVEGRMPDLRLTITSERCNHCDRPPCVTCCPTGASHVHDYGKVVLVDHDKCIGCKACARACPRNIITMVPFKSDRMLVVACSNQDAGPDVKAVCEVGCIGCKGCSRRADQVEMEGNLPVIDYDLYGSESDFQVALEKCPRARLTFVGKPSEADLAAVADEELPDEIKADFKTTVDETQWRG